MILKSIQILNFKNIKELSISFDEKINCLVGENGEGKTNLLDAIYYLAYTKGYFHNLDQHNVHFDETSMMIRGQFIDNQQEIYEIHTGVMPGVKKTFSKNNKKYERLLDHIGLIPLVMITPFDQQLINEGSGERRKFIDGLLSNLDQQYLQHLQNYLKLVVQKNTCLKQLKEQRSKDFSLVNIYNAQIEKPAKYIQEKRVEFLKVFNPIFQEFYKDISGNKESVNIEYAFYSNEQSAQTEAQLNVRELAVGHCLSGPHKDDLLFNLKEHTVKQFASQGQQKSFVLAMKLAACRILEQHKNQKPIVLLDDIFDKLDNKRINYLLQLIKDNKLGQCFVSDAHPERLKIAMQSTGIEPEMFIVKQGIISKGN